MKSRIFRFYILSACGACVLTGILAAGMTGWMLRQEGNMPQVRELPTAWAMGADRHENFITCSGPVDSGLEAVYILDTNTGMLTANVPAKTLDKIQARYGANVSNDLNAWLRNLANPTGKKTPAGAAATGNIPAMPSSPKYVMTTAMHDSTARINNTVPATAALCVTEVNTGIMLVYVIPWSRQAHASGQDVQATLKPLFAYRVIRPQVEETEL